MGHAEDGAARLVRLADDGAGKWPKRRRLLRKWLWLEKFVDDLDHLNAVEALSALEGHQEAAAALLTRCAQDASLHGHLRRSAAATLAGMAERRENGAALLARLARDPAVGHGRSEASGTITRMTSDPQPPAGTRTHIRLLAGHAGAGRPVFEVLPARPVQSDLFRLAGSPGMVLGCAAGDVLRVADDGQFEVVEQGDNWCIQAAGLGRLSPGSFVALREAAAVLPGMAEAPADLRFIVVTVSRTVGLPAIERVMDTWAAGIDGVEWWLGNGDHPAASA
ncbi:DUF4265 domain-containing protein [Kitasatospora sp. NBC_00240]|uniref:DUF4265 domain-containing protein n=1 Tax=Kitasatospora sp. NBC_00240 TaxID=2903567 RepID=UPI00225AC988|nr:DUF4265 domain-containing protein [Kitasatospora sp. NBC_00240]MCX5215327.1 DUF4265 domain-containing protein [Kitasatospora sp. NBC_00240]